MRHLITISIIFCFLTTNAQQNQIQGLEPFNKIEVFGNLDVELKLGNKETIKIKTYKVEHEKVSFKVVDNTLKVSLKTKLFDEDVKAKVYISYKEILKIRSDAGAEIKVIDKIVGDRLTVEAANGGRVLLNVRIEHLELKLFQGSHIDISGACLKQNAFVNTGSVLSATNLECDEATIKLNTKAKAEIVANKRINAKVNTYSTLSFFGNPKDEILKTTIGGEISKWDEDEDPD